MAEETKREFYERTHPDGQNSDHEVTDKRVDHPEGKYKYITDSSDKVTRPKVSNTVNRPTSSNTVTRPSNSTAVILSDTSTVNTFFSVNVLKADKNQETVADVVLGEKSRKSGKYKLTGGYGVQFQQSDACEKAMYAGSQAILLDADVRVTKNITVINDFVHLKKGTPVTDQGNVRTVYYLYVNAWGNHKSQVMDILFGADRNPNLDSTLPVKLTYEEPQKEQAFAMADRLLDAEADITLKKLVAVDVQLY